MDEINAEPRSDVEPKSQVRVRINENQPSDILRVGNPKRYSIDLWPHDGSDELPEYMFSFIITDDGFTEYSIYNYDKVQSDDIQNLSKDQVVEIFNSLKKLAENKSNEPGYTAEQLYADLLKEFKQLLARQLNAQGREEVSTITEGQREKDSSLPWDDLKTIRTLDEEKFIDVVKRVKIELAKEKPYILKDNTPYWLVISDDEGLEGRVLGVIYAYALEGNYGITYDESKIKNDLEEVFSKGEYNVRFRDVSLNPYALEEVMGSGEHDIHYFNSSDIFGNLIGREEKYITNIDPNY